MLIYIYIVPRELAKPSTAHNTHQTHQTLCGVVQHSTGRGFEYYIIPLFGCRCCCCLVCKKPPNLVLHTANVFSHTSYKMNGQRASVSLLVNSRAVASALMLTAKWVSRELVYIDGRSNWHMREVYAAWEHVMLSLFILSSLSLTIRYQP